MRIGILVTGDIAVRAAHSLSAHSGVDEVVVVGPARSRSFPVVEDGTGCDLLIGTGPEAPSRAAAYGVGLVWDGGTPEPGVVVYGASPVGLTLALASREPDLRLVAVAHPDLEEAGSHEIRFPHPVGTVGTEDVTYGGWAVATGRSSNAFAASLVVGGERSVTIVDEGRFLSGIALAAGATVAGDAVLPVWERGLAYLETVTAMGLLLADDQRT